MSRLDKVLEHRRAHERPLLEAEVLIKPDAVGLPASLEENLLHIDRQVGKHLDHIANPVRIQRHAHEHVLMPANRVHLLENVHAAPAEKFAAFLGELFLSRVAFEIHALLIKILI